jgi:hypothetical protein
VLCLIGEVECGVLLGSFVRSVEIGSGVVLVRVVPRAQCVYVYVPSPDILYLSVVLCAVYCGCVMCTAHHVRLPLTSLDLCIVVCTLRVLCALLLMSCTCSFHWHIPPQP